MLCVKKIIYLLATTVTATQVTAWNLEESTKNFLRYAKDKQHKNKNWVMFPSFPAKAGNDFTPLPLCEKIFNDFEVSLLRMIGRLTDIYKRC